MARTKNAALTLAFKGRWRIVAMDLWDQDAIDLVEPSFIAFNGEEGKMRSIAVRAWLDVRYATRDGAPIAEFSWEGVDEGDQRSGRGWVKLMWAAQASGQVTMSGRIIDRYIPKGRGAASPGPRIAHSAAAKR